MHKWQILVSIFALLVICSEVKAGDEEDVLANVNSWYTQLAAGDVEAMEISPHTRFSLHGGLLSVADPKKMKAWLSTPGLKINIHGHHGDVEVYGDAAVYTGYECVNITPPDGEERQETNRLTVVFAKKKGDWKVVHVHVSSLTPVNPE